MPWPCYSQFCAAKEEEEEEEEEEDKRADQMRMRWPCYSQLQHPLRPLLRMLWPCYSQFCAAKEEEEKVERADQVRMQWACYFQLQHDSRTDAGKSSRVLRGIFSGTIRNRLCIRQNQDQQKVCAAN